MVTRQSFYSWENEAEIVVRLNQSSISQVYRATMFLKSGSATVTKIITNNELLRLSFPLSGISNGDSIGVELTLANGTRLKGGCRIAILKYKPNEVKTDRLTGALISGKKPFFPVGFYCYSPVAPTLAAEEIVNGFTVVSPYQKILPETLEERKAYMDQCALAGMKVHYNLLSVSGGGGVNSKIPGLSDNEKRERLIAEIRNFMDHPALLAWYISDEPTGNRVSPETLEEIYRVVKQEDPWHPVSIVFMAPFRSARKYSEATDIVMADPYPIPDYPAGMAGDVASLLANEFRGEKPVWIVPQAFGGGELWEREPTPGEIRSMTWQAVVNGASGIQYFIRSGPNYFPKSVLAWNECSRAATEIMSVSPWLLSEKRNFNLNTGNKNVQASSGEYKGHLLITAVNRINETIPVTINSGTAVNGTADVLFENRKIKVTAGRINDYIAPFGRNVYLLKKDEVPANFEYWKGNLIRDPGFSNTATPGIPSATYAWGSSERGGTYFTDPTESADGLHSLRLTSPSEKGGVTLRLFPVKVTTGRSYIISVMAKSNPELTYTIKDNTSNRLFAEIGFGEFAKAKILPDSDWKQFVTFVTIPADTLPTKKVNLRIRLVGQGTAWFDMIQVVEDPVSVKNVKQVQR